MEVTKVTSIAAARFADNVRASQSKQDGLIEYLACMSGIDLPEKEEPEGMEGHDGEQEA